MKILVLLSKIRPYHAAVLMLGLLFFLPFSLAWRVGPQPGFFLEAMAAGLLLLMVLGVAASGLLPHKLPVSVWWLLAFAVFFPVQSIMMQLPYQGYAWLMCALWLMLALAAWALAGLRTRIGLSGILQTIATALLLAVLWQSFVSWMQFFNLTRSFFGLMIHAPTPYYVFGQLGQRNHLGHFMMWGLLATAYLFAERRLSVYLSLFSLLVISATLGIISSRTILLYIAFLLPICLFYSIRRPEQRRMALTVICALLTVLLAQWALPILFNHLGIDMQSGLERATDGGGETASRLHEWHKAWLVFLDKPWFGVGWMGYAYQSMDKAQLFTFNDIPHLNVLFTHCHNVILQLLAEVGLVGTLLLAGGCLWMMRALFRLPASHHALLLGSVISVSLIHSMLEYPLWYVYFMLPFFVLLLLAANQDTSERLPATRFTHNMVLLAVCCIFGAVLYQSFQYKRLVKLNTPTTVNQCHANAEALHQFAVQSLFLSYYADAASTRCLGLMFAPQHDLPWLSATLQRSATFRPFPTQAVQWGVQQVHDGHHAAAQDWMFAIWRYYPRRVTGDHILLETQPELAPLRTSANRVRALENIESTPN
ncbi:MAG: Wzy polymerase domain-containing protein [Neisseria sp.]|nr:Wzy polymerase domain-containing protein [Neisseria sp.]